MDRYLAAQDDSAEQASLAELIALAEPVIRRTVLARLAGRWDDIDDVCSEARLELLLHARRMKRQPAIKPIEDFATYAGTLARNTCFRYFRRRRPDRTRLKKQVRFVLSDEAGFATRQMHGRIWCGLSGWSESQPPGRLPDAGSIQGERDLSELLRQIFSSSGGPVELGPLVDLIADIWRIPAGGEVEVAEGPADIPATLPAPDTVLDQRRFIGRLWREVAQLPVSQRVALLLNLTDGRGSSVLALFTLSGVAGFRDLASALEMTEEKLAGLWPELPLEDNVIGTFLNCPRQRVINLRMAARKRLANRLGNPPW
ncbi:MAG: sigma-70 family RNA polymerase sigma factor [Bryobacterales bacterium]|nr:sigma-70 family RNA polymerase sigma factor [Bryobacterales bacterium]